MKIEKIEAKEVLNSRRKPTVEVEVVTKKGKFKSSAPSGKSKGKFAAKPYLKNIQQEIAFLNKLKTEKLRIEKFKDLIEIEGLTEKNIGANSLFALESSVLKALAAEQGKELWQLLSKTKQLRFPFPIGNAIGGGMHSSGKKPDFQEFLFISKMEKFSDRVRENRKAYELAGKILKARRINDEGAWETTLGNEKVLEIMKKIRDNMRKIGNIEIGVDVAASTFFKGNYNYKNKKQKLNREKQIGYIEKLAEKYNLFYIEDPLQEEDFLGFSELKRKIKGLVAGDDLTVTNLLRVKKAFQKKSINALIVKPNQNGSLLKVREICDFCKNRGIQIVFSHRSGETLDTTIADLAVAWQADYIKAGIFGKEREVKLNRIIEIENRV